MGSAGGVLPQKVRSKARKLGGEIAACSCVLVTGACPGLPYDAVMGCKQAGGMTVGISPALNLYEHVHRYLSPHEHFDVLVYTGDGLMGREVPGIRSCDIVILVGGRSGTLGEFAIAYDEGKLIGVLEGTGGIADHVEEIVGLINKDTGATLIFDEDPAKLMAKLLAKFSARPKKSPALRKGAG